MRPDLGFIVEGHCEYEAIPAIVSKIKGSFNYPISNAMGIGNIIKNTGDELLRLLQVSSPKKVIISLDYRDAEREGIVDTCIELKDIVKNNCIKFLESQKNGSLILPEEIVVVIADKTYESWICADLEGLKSNELIDASSISESFANVDTEINNPGNWLNSKLKNNINLKSRAYRKKIIKTIRPEVAKENSRSFRKFYKEVDNS